MAQPKAFRAPASAAALAAVRNAPHGAPIRASSAARSSAPSATRDTAPLAAARSSASEPELDAPLVPADCTWPIVLGIDPGTRALGFGAIVLAPGGARLVTAGVLRPGNAHSEPAQRLAELAAALPRLIARCRPQCVAVERAFAARNVHSALRLGEARGVALACAAASGARVIELSPSQVRKSVLGIGSGTKEQVAFMVARLLRHDLSGLGLDASDALALALAAARAVENALARTARR
jgi:crossover junction endodeoxyribonuclease RuvC